MYDIVMMTQSKALQTERGGLTGSQREAGPEQPEKEGGK